MSFKRILTVQDISCIGQCSLTVALPILSACGVETGILPSAVLSTHTGGFSGYTFRDLTDDIPAIQAHWLKEGIRFDAFYTGFLGSARQIAYVKNLFATLGKPGALTIVDPAMADFGKLYPGFDLEFVREMTGLCTAADVILPNLTEACLMTNTPYREDYDEAFIDTLLVKLSALGAKAIILTGIGFKPKETGVMVYQDGRKQHYVHKRIERGCHGTGDVFASTFTGSLLRGKSLYDAARIAADFTLRCIENTLADEGHWYGVNFESVMPELLRMLED